MKKIYIIGFFVVIATALSFAQVNAPDNDIIGTGKFKAKILDPLIIECINPMVDLGEFVKAPSSPYNSDVAPTVFNEALMDFTITGEPWQTFHLTIEPELTNSFADIKIRTNLALEGNVSLPVDGMFTIINGTATFSDILDDIGTYMFYLECYEVTARESGEGLFEQTVTVSYNL